MIHIHKTALDSRFAKRLINKNIDFAVFEELESIPDRKTEFVLLPKMEEFCHTCPGTKNYCCCNYHVIDAVEGCPFDCSYCILQAYLPHKNIQINSKTDNLTTAIETVCKSGKILRIGTGELSDSLALDNLFPYSELIIPIVNKYDNILFEFKTKSANISNLLNLNPKNVMISWSLNPEEIINSDELGTASLLERVEAAKICSEYGYKVGFHFDPIIYYDGYQNGYKNVVDLLLNSINESSVHFISMSTFRGTTALIDEMRKREYISQLLKGDFISGLDNKVRYFKPLRIELLDYVTKLFRREWKQAFIYFCMEHQSVWDKVQGFNPSNDREEFERHFPTVR